jgi:hypothetical protein
MSAACLHRRHPEFCFRLNSVSGIFHCVQLSSSSLKRKMADHNKVKKGMWDLIFGCFSSSKTKD